MRETGKVKVLEIFSKAKTLPFPINGQGCEIDEAKRPKFRYLDLRREKLKRNLILRQKVIHFIRNFLIQEGFIEIEASILIKSTSEGARDFLVPARLQPGEFYPLPQQYKQLSMVAGIERYFQITKCFRDKDPRAESQAEFTQLDIEMAFATKMIF